MDFISESNDPAIAGTGRPPRDTDGTSAGSCSWSKEHPCSKTGTCLPLFVDGGSSRGIPPLQLVWKGDEALDKLHIALRVQIPSGSFQKDAVKADKKDTGRSELAEGHCAIGLEKLCKLALCASEVADSDDFSQRQNVHVRSSVAQLLIKDGVPMYNMDASTLQRELVTLCCTVELIIHDEKL